MGPSASPAADGEKHLSPTSSDTTEAAAGAVDARKQQPKSKRSIFDPRRRNALRGKLPTVIKGPLNALFPLAVPSALYDTPPAFVLEANSRSRWRNRKTFVRIAIVFLANVVLLVDQTTLRVLGKVAFFGLIVACLIPPMFPVQLFIIAAFALTFGMALGWAWGCAAMAAALRARDLVLTASQVMTVKGSISSATNPEEAYTKRLFEGAFLDWKSSLVFGVFLFVGSFGMGLLRAKVPILLVTSLFGSIIIDVMTAYGPLFPNQNYTLSTMFMVPTACYLAIAIAGTIIIFPQTVSHALTEGLVDRIISPVRQRADLHAKILATPPPSDDDDAAAVKSHRWSTLGEMWIATQEAISSGLELLMIALPLSELELSMGQLSAKDYRSLVEPIRELVTRSISLASFWSTISVRLSHTSADGDEAKRAPGQRTGAGPEREYASKANRELRRKLRETERQQGHDSATLLALLNDASTEVRHADDAALAALSQWLIAQNDARWAWIFSSKARHAEELSLAELDEKVQHLESALLSYRQEHRLRLLEPFREFFDPETGRALPLAERRRRAGPDAPIRLFAPESLITVLAASDDVTTYSESVLDLARKFLDLGHRRRKSRLWLPTGLRRIGHLLTRRGHHASGADLINGSENPDAVEEPEADDVSPQEAAGNGAAPAKSQSEGRNGRNAFDELMKTPNYSPDARPPRNVLQRFGRYGYGFIRWWATPDVIFALKYAAATLVIWLPQVFKSTAWLAYTEKVRSRALKLLWKSSDSFPAAQLVWAQITAQTFMAPYAGDQILATIERVIATALGLVYGMLMWYIGAANGRGTRVGNGASIFVLSLPLLAARVHSSMQKALFPIMIIVTALLVAGYSWNDGYLPRVGNPGQGTDVAWRRGLLVMIGAGVGLVFMILPPAYSSRTLVRRTHATCLEQLGRVYAAITTLWIEEQQLDDDFVAKEDRSSGAGKSTDEVAPTSLATQRAARARIIAIRRKLNGAKLTAEQAVFELSLRGDWPVAEYKRLLRYQLGLLQSLSQLGRALVRLEPRWRKRLVHETAFLNQPLIADVTTSFSLISLALRQGVPLPAAMPGPLLDRLIYHDARLKRLGNVVATADEADDVSSAVKAEGAHFGDFPITFNVLRDENFGIYASAVEALANLLIYVDEAELTAKAVLGEVGFPGYSMLADRAARGDV
ncbi:hypothetical protein JCM8115_004766 [Rhodotorula mucilaginosa]